MFKTFLTALALGILHLAYGQNGFRGEVIDKEGLSVPKAKVLVMNTPYIQATYNLGEFTIQRFTQRQLYLVNNRLWI